MTSRTNGEETWRLDLRFAGLGRGGALVDSGAAEPASDGERIEVRRASLTEWYVNDEKGLEQGFTIFARPGGDRSLPLTIEMGLGGSLLAYPSEDGLSILFKDAAGTPALRYSELKVVDARENVLDGRLTVRPGRLEIQIDDTSAAYPVTVDPLMTSPVWMAEGNQTEVEFGYSAATAGDVNGDGYSDVIVSALWYDNGEVDEGRAFLYYGSPLGLLMAPGWITEGNQETARFGRSAAAAGDVNGDGYDDVVIGADLYDHGETDEGRAFLYYGSPSGLQSTPGWTGESDQANVYYGVSVATAGDVNGDGYDDVIVGAYMWDGIQQNEGRAYVYLGSASGLSPASTWKAEGFQMQERFGYSVSTAGDVNADGYDDILVGASDYDNGQTDEGRACVYRGSASGVSPTPSWCAEGDQGSAFFGRCVSTAGDLNGDGYADVIVGAPSYDNGEADEGAAFVYMGSASGLGLLPDVILEGNQASAAFGRSVSTAGDVNGDGYADLIVGAYNYVVGEAASGRVFMYQGSASRLSTTPSWTVEGSQSDARFGISVATAGDVNGDGYSDVIVGADLWDSGEAEEGRAFVYYGSASGCGATPSWTAESDQVSAQFGDSVASAGDVNGDGYSDVIVGAPYYDNGQTDEGRAYVYLGSGSGIAISPAWTAESDQPGAKIGYSVASAGDVNGDGYSDVIVGAPYYTNATNLKVGRAYVYLGSASGLAMSPAWTAESNQDWAVFGFAVATAGDVNGDGYSDVIVGAPDYDNGQTDEGRAYVYLGSASGLATSSAWTAEANQSDAGFGNSVATAGDVNGDAYSDVIVGADQYSNQASFTVGRAFLYLGSGSGPAISPAWTAVLDQTQARLGYSVATAGDVNGDGYADVIVGAPYYDGYDSDRGRAILYLGSAVGLAAAPAWTAESDQGSAKLGCAVSFAGDVNGDGYSDVIVGAHQYGNGQPREGRAYIYSGSASGLGASPAWVAEADLAYGYFGDSLASAGDVNGDGYSDVIVGAPGYGNGESAEGRAFVYYGNASSGLARIPRQARANDTAPIGLLGQSDSADSFRLKGTGRTPLGRGKVRLEWEVKPQGSGFNGGGLGHGTWTDTGAPGPGGSSVSLNQLLSGLQPATSYKWRARFASNSPLFPYTPWFSLPYNGITEAKLKTKGYDSDGDLHPDSTDNCPYNYNPSQADGEGNGVGDVCDTPKVMQVVPVGGSTGVPVWADVTVGFSEPMDPATITTSTFRVLVTGSPIAGTVSVSADAMSAVFDPASPMATSTVHQVELTTGVRDLQSASLGTTTSSFTTEASSVPNDIPLADVPSEDVSTGTAPSEHRGAALAGIGDINGDGYDDWLVGSPDYSEGGLTARGRVELFLGSASGSHQTPDVTFLGHAAGDRLGISVAGGQDFEGLGPDILLGAEQHDGTTAYGAGRAYLVSFNANWIGTTQDVEMVAKITFVGKASGDRAGHSVAMSPDLNGDGLGEVLIGAPYADHGTNVDCGEAYLIYGKRGQTGPVALGDVGSVSSGITYYGHAAGDGLGFSVSAGSDFNGDGRPDLVLSAPFADITTPGRFTVSPDAGSVHLDVGPLQEKGIIDVDAVGTDPGSHEGIRLIGDQSSQKLGYAVALIPDHTGDHLAEVLAGAPYSDVGTNADAGEVFLLEGMPITPSTPTEVNSGTLCDPGNAYGTCYQGASASDKLGYSVGTAGDTNGDGLSETMMGAPGFDATTPTSMPDAGATYIDIGGPVQEKGIIDVDSIGVDIPGAVLIGEHAGDSSGYAVAGVGDTNGDGQDDFAVGAPNFDTVTATDAGASYLVTEDPAPVPSGGPACGPSGCTVTDALTGARLDVPAGSLAAPVPLGVKGILSVGLLPTPEPAGKMLAGAADFDPEGQSFGTPNPTATLPVRPEVEGQLTGGETVDLYYFNGASWIDSGRDGTVGLGLQRKVVTGTISVLHVYAVFLSDVDGDGRRDSLDCAPANSSAFAVPTEIGNLRFTSQSALAWDSDAPNSGSGTRYDPMRGKITEWPVGSGASETCWDGGSIDTLTNDATLPAPGAGFYYLVRGSNVCGDGTYGFRSNGTQRTSSACP